ncbi:MULTISPECIES: hypothetical protein [unclassified Actinotalea]|uniref:hypothetical protein n=1 Tax=unclassified Actinotalea TaxID=2638618 RepID=UPI0015F44EE6|nr:MULTISPECIES: hypothetical protein [unclassified Actinotalea]
MSAHVDALAAPHPGTWVASVVATPSSEPELQEGVDPDSVTPGVLGFLVTLAAVVACIPLFLSMTRKIRGVQHRGRLETEAEEERAAGDGPAGGPARDAEAPEGTDPGGPRG